MSEEEEETQYYANIMIETELVGVNFYSTSGIKKGMDIDVERDFVNLEDMWAIKAVGDREDTIGYIVREHAIHIAPIMDYIAHYPMGTEPYISAKVTGNRKWTTKGQAYPIQVCFLVGRWLEKQIIKTLDTFGMEYEVHFIIQ